MSFQGDGVNLGQYAESLQAAGQELDPTGTCRQAIAMQVQLLGLWYERILRIKSDQVLRSCLSSCLGLIARGCEGRLEETQKNAYQNHSFAT